MLRLCYSFTIKDAAQSIKLEIRLRANLQPSSERMSQSEERKNNFGTRSCVRANLGPIA